MFRMRSSVCIVAAMMSFVLASSAFCGSMMFRGGPQRTGNTALSGPKSTALAIAWTYEVGTSNDWVCSTPAMDEAANLIVFGANDKKVHAIDLSGALLWSYKTGGQVYSSPLLMGGKVFVGSLDGKLYSFTYDGQLEWTYETGGAIYSSPLGYSAAGVDTVAFGSDDGKVYALRTDGSLVWSYQTDGWVSSSPAASPEGDLYVCSYDGHLYAFAVNGAFRWRFDAGSQIFATPAIGPDGGILFGTLGGTFFKVWPDGSEAFRFEADGAIFASCAIDAQNYSRFGTIGHVFYRIAPTGEPDSSYISGQTTPIYYLSSPLVDVDGNSYVGTLGRTLYCFNAACNRTLWRFYMERAELGANASGIYGSLILDSSERLYVPCMDGKLYCFEAGSGRAPKDANAALYNELVQEPLADAQGQTAASRAQQAALPVGAAYGPGASGKVGKLGPQGPGTLLDEALKMTGYSYSAIAIDYSPVPKDAYRLDLVEHLLAEDPTDGPAVVRELSDDLEYECPTLQEKILKVASMADISVEPVSFTHVFGSSPLEEAIRAVYTRHGVALIPDQEAKLATINGIIGRSIQEALGLLLLAMDEATRLRDEALAALSPTEKESIFSDIMDPRVIYNLHPLFPMFDVYGKVDRAKIVQGGAIVASVIDSLLSGVRSGPDWQVAPGAQDRTKVASVSGDVIFSFETPIGAVVLGGYGPTTYTTNLEPSPQDIPTLIVDLGGDDFYYNYLPDNLRESIAASVTIDVSGNDTYRTTYNNAQGSGNLGVGFCIDLSGDDYYESDSFSQGAGWGGVGVLWDMGGNDQYYGDECCQGAGFMGVGLLIDSAGNDSYRVGEFGQAFGYVHGAGVLMDLAGDDLYFAGGDEVHQYEPPRTTSMSQGYGFGVRLNTIGEPQASGGVGLLVDSAGDDTFISDFFGTAGAYWFGLGMLMNRSGNDLYMARQYSIASGIHLAVGILVDDEGDDTYVCRALSEGCAHDNSVGILVDNAGDDVYLAQDFSQGASSPRSFSALIDNGGNDMYWAMPGHLDQGEARYDDNEKSSLSLILDSGGRDFYSIVGADNTRWTTGFYGVGIDSDFVPTGLH